MMEHLHLDIAPGYRSVGGVESVESDEGVRVLESAGEDVGVECGEDRGYGECW